MPTPSQISCSAIAKHAIIGAKTDRKQSLPMYLGLRIVPDTVTGPGNLTLQEGGAPGYLRVTPTLPLTCPRPLATSLDRCCLELDVTVDSEQGSSGLYCPNSQALDRLQLPTCKPKLCSDETSALIPLSAVNDFIINGDEEVKLKIGLSGGSKMWNDYSPSVQTVIRQYFFPVNKEGMSLFPR